MTNTATPAIPNLRTVDLGQRMTSLVNVSIDWIRQYWLEIALATAAGVVIVLILHALRRYAGRFCKPGSPMTSWPAITGRALTRTTNFFIVMAAAKLVDGYAAAPHQVTETINFLFVIAAGFQVAIWVREVVLGMVEHRANAENYRGETIVNALGIIRLVVSVTVFGIAIIVILGNLGVNVTGLVAGLGVGGIAIGLAAQGIFADLFAALAIIFDRPFSKGDVIGFDTTIGTVEEIGLKSTRIRPASGEEHIIANKQLLEKEIRNISRRNHRSNKFTLGVVYQTPADVLARIPDMLREEVEKLGHEFAQAGFVAFNTSSLDIELEYDTLSPAFAPWYQARHDVGLAIVRRFAAEGIEFAYPTQTSFTAAPDGTLIMPYPEVQPVKRVDLTEEERRGGD